MGLIKVQNKFNKNIQMFESIFICFLKLYSSVLKGEFDSCHHRSIYYQDKYNTCAT